jgi:sugar/nucleoside kinase (ribokinase family)
MARRYASRISVWRRRSNCAQEALSRAKVAIINYRFDSYALRAARIARDARGIVILSAVAAAPAYVTAFINTTDILICTDYELQQVAEYLKLDSHADLFKRGLRALIATRGKAGSRVVTAEKTIDVPIAPALRVVDPVGAGDGFVGGTATGLAFGYTLEDAARLGAVVASFVVEAWGCQSNLPTFAEAADRFSASFERVLPERSLSKWTHLAGLRPYLKEEMGPNKQS